MSEIRLRTDELAWHEIDGTIVCLSLADSQYLSVNAAGAVLWPLLIDGAERETLTSRLVDEFGIDHDSAAKDVENFLGVLTERKLLIA